MSGVIGIRPGSGKIRLLHCASWKPTGEKREVDLIAVREHVYLWWQKLGYPPISFDPSQAFLMAQELTALGVNMVKVGFVPAQLTLFAQGIMMAFRNHMLELFPDPDLIRDLERLSIVGKPPYGYKLEAISDEERSREPAYGIPERGRRPEYHVPAQMEAIRRGLQRSRILRLREAEGGGRRNLHLLLRQWHQVERAEGLGGRIAHPLSWSRVYGSPKPLP
jgi:hypothetical protein